MSEDTSLLDKSSSIATRGEVAFGKACKLDDSTAGSKEFRAFFEAALVGLGGVLDTD